jgi:hypothetical protein
MSYEIVIVKINDYPTAQYIGRGSPLGNPYPIKPGMSRNTVCDMYEKYFYENIKANCIFYQELKRLHEVGKKEGILRLGCFCSPNRCHGETIKNYLDTNKILFDELF